MERIKVYQVLDGERDYQDDMWGQRNKLNGVPDSEKSLSEWICYMEYHINKLKTKIYTLDQQEALAELRKVTALGVKAMEALDCPPRKGYERGKEYDFYCSTFHPRKMKFIIPVGSIPDDEIDAYIAKITAKFKKNSTTTVDGFDLKFPDSDIFYPKKSEEPTE